MDSVGNQFTVLLLLLLRSVYQSVPREQVFMERSEGIRSGTAQQCWWSKYLICVFPVLLPIPISVCTQTNEIVEMRQRTRKTKLLCKYSTSPILLFYLILGQHNRAFLRSAWMSRTYMESLSPPEKLVSSWVTTLQKMWWFPEIYQPHVFHCGQFFSFSRLAANPSSLYGRKCADLTCHIPSSAPASTWMLIKKMPVDVEQLISSPDTE